MTTTTSTTTPPQSCLVWTHITAVDMFVLLLCRESQREQSAGCSKSLRRHSKTAVTSPRSPPNFDESRYHQWEPCRQRWWDQRTASQTSVDLWVCRSAGRVLVDVLDAVSFCSTSTDAVLKSVPSRQQRRRGAVRDAAVHATKPLSDGSVRHCRRYADPAATTSVTTGWYLRVVDDSTERDDAWQSPTTSARTSDDLHTSIHARATSNHNSRWTSALQTLTKLSFAAAGLDKAAAWITGSG